MKRTFILTLALAAFVFINGGEVKAQSLKRIEFAKGKSSAIVKGNTGNYGAAFIVRAKSGQKLVLNLTPISKVGIMVEGGGAVGETVLLREEKGGIYQVGLEETGDYVVFIGSKNNEPISFTLTVKIGKITDI